MNDRETKMIPNGVTRPALVSVKLTKEAFELEKDSYLLYLGCIVPEKGEHYLIEAFKKIKTEKKLVIAGGVSDSAVYMDKLKGMANGDDSIKWAKKESLRNRHRGWMSAAIQRCKG